MMTGGKSIGGVPYLEGGGRGSRGICEICSEARSVGQGRVPSGQAHAALCLPRPPASTARERIRRPPSLSSPCALEIESCRTSGHVVVVFPWHMWRCVLHESSITTCPPGSSPNSHTRRNETPRLTRQLMSLLLLDDLASPSELGSI